MTETYVIVHRSYDPVQADMLGDLLRENGIAARVLGTRHGAVIGVGQNILQMHIEVPQSQAGEATDFLEAFFEGRGDELLRDEAGLEVPWDSEDEDADDRDAGADEPGTAAATGPRRPLFAAGLALVLGVVGGGHWYARRPWTASLLAAGQLAALVNIASPRWESVATGLVMFATILAIDLLGGQLSVRAHNRGVRASPLRQLMTGACFLALAGAVGSVAGPRIPEPDWEQRSQVHVPRGAAVG